MGHKIQKFVTYFLALSLFWLLIAMDYFVQLVGGAYCDKFGPGNLLSNCTVVRPLTGIPPEGIEVIATIIALAGIILSAAAAYEISRRQK